jgi:hypothetical protein
MGVDLGRFIFIFRIFGVDRDYIGKANVSILVQKTIYRFTRRLSSENDIGEKCFN